MTDKEILDKMISAYRKALDDKQRMKDEKILWHNQACARCGRPPGKHSSADIPFCPGFTWGEEEFEAADANNRKINWLKS